MTTTALLAALAGSLSALFLVFDCRRGVGAVYLRRHLSGAFRCERRAHRAHPIRCFSQKEMMTRKFSQKCAAGCCAREKMTLRGVNRPQAFVKRSPCPTPLVSVLDTGITKML